MNKIITFSLRFWSFTSTDTLLHFLNLCYMQFYPYTDFVVFWYSVICRGVIFFFFSFSRFFSSRFVIYYENTYLQFHEFTFYISCFNLLQDFNFLKIKLNLWESPRENVKELSSGERKKKKKIIFWVYSIQSYWSCLLLDIKYESF